MRSTCYAKRAPRYSHSHAYAWSECAHERVESVQWDFFFSTPRESYLDSMHREIIQSELLNCAKGKPGLWFNLRLRTGSYPVLFPVILITVR